MPLERVMPTQLPPHLAEAWIDIHEDAPLDATEDILIVSEAHDVEQQIRRGGLTYYIFAAASNYSFAAVVNEREAFSQSELTHYVQEVAQIRRILKRGGIAARINTHRR